jgi:cyclic pyranopterin phosphate synthase
MTRGGKLATVLDGIDAALGAGFDEVKLNCVVVRGENDDEIEDLTRWAWERNIVPRFLEVMAIGEGDKLRDRVVRATEMRARIAHLLLGGEALAETDRGPAKYLPARHDPKKRVGFITGTSDTYCQGCDRLRVAANGKLRPCLATNDGVDANEAVKSGDPSRVAALVGDAWAMKPDGETWKGCTEPTARSVSIRQIGG